MTEKEFAEIMAVLSAGVGRPMAKETARVWFECLRDLEQSVLRAAVVSWLCRNNSGFPTIAAIRAEAREYTRGPSLLPGQAWAMRCKAIKIFSSYRPTEAREYLGELVWSAIQQTGGWEAHCDVLPHERQTLSAQFRKAFEAQAEQTKKIALTPERFRGVGQSVKTLADSFSIPDEGGSDGEKSSVKKIEGQQAG